MNKEAIIEGLLFVVGDEGLTIKAISEILETDIEETKELLKNLHNKYEEDRKYNLEAIETGKGRVLNVYELNNNRFYINSYVSKKGSRTIADETMIMLCDEY